MSEVSACFYRSWSSDQSILSKWQPQIHLVLPPWATPYLRQCTVPVTKWRLLMVKCLCKHCLGPLTACSCLCLKINCSCTSSPVINPQCQFLSNLTHWKSAKWKQAPAFWFFFHPTPLGSHKRQRTLWSRRPQQAFIGAAKFLFLTSNKHYC